MRRAWPRWKSLLAVPLLLGAGACTPHPGEEPLYVLRDSLGRAVAMAGRSQLGDAAPGTMLRVNLGSGEQEVMVGERVGLGSVLTPRPVAPPAEVAAAPAAAEAPAEAAPAAAITSAPLDPPAAEAPADAGRTANRRARSAATEAGENPSGRRRGPPPASVSRSVM